MQAFAIMPFRIFAVENYRKRNTDVCIAKRNHMPLVTIRHVFDNEFTRVNDSAVVVSVACVSCAACVSPATKGSAANRESVKINKIPAESFNMFLSFFPVYTNL